MAQKEISFASRDDSEFTIAEEENIATEIEISINSIENIVNITFDLLNQFCAKISSTDASWLCLIDQRCKCANQIQSGTPGNCFGRESINQN